jgi:hypothetical protein
VLGLVFLALQAFPSIITAQSVLIHRSLTSGNWTTLSTWEELQADGSWIAATTYPEDRDIEYIFPQIRSSISSTTGNTSTTSHSISIPAGEIGDLLIVLWSDGTAVSTLTTPANWSVLYDLQGIENNRAYCIYGTATDAAASTLVITSSGSERSSHVTYRIAAGTYHSVSPIVASTLAQFSGANPDPPLLTTSFTNTKTLWLAPVHLEGSPGPTVIPANYVSPAIVGFSGNEGAGRATVFSTHRFLASQSENPGAYTLAKSKTGSAVTIAIQGAETEIISKALIRSGHQISVDATLLVDSVVVENGGILAVPTGIDLSLTSNGNLSIQAGGTLEMQGTSAIKGTGNVEVLSAGILKSGSPLGINLSGVSGNIQNSGLRSLANGVDFIFNGLSAQQSGNAIVQSAPGSLQIANSFGVTSPGTITLSGVFQLSSGKLVLPSGDSLVVTNTASTAVVGGSATSYLQGIMVRSFLSSTNSSDLYHYPVGTAGAYLPFGIFSPSTGSGIVRVRVSAFSENAGGAGGFELVSLDPSAYWEINPGSSIINGKIRIESASVPSFYDAVAGSLSKTGDYQNLGGSIASNEVTSQSLVGINRFFVLANAKYIWNGSLTSDWFTSSNWNKQMVPGSNAAVIIPETGNQPIIAGLSNAEVRFSSGNLTIQNNAHLTLSAGPSLIFEATSSMSTNGNSKIIIEPQARYLNISASQPVLEVQQLITGTMGWRNLSSPVATTYLDLLDSLVTQNFTGSNFSDLQPNLLWWDETNVGTTLQGWRQPASITDSVQAGRGHFHFVFDGAGRLNPDGSPSGIEYADSLPIVITANGKEPKLTDSPFVFSPFTFTERNDDPSAQNPLTDSVFYDINIADEGWNLVGNPTPSTLNWDANSGWIKTKMDNSIYIWDPAANSGNGDYLTWNGFSGSLGNGMISPFQAFWVRSTAASPVLSFDNEVKSSLESEFYGKSFENIETINFPISLESDNQKATVFISLNEESSVGEDAFDAYRLEPLTDTWVSLFLNSSIAHSMPLVINSIDQSFGEEIHIPLYTDVHEENRLVSGEFKLSWDVPVEWPVGMQVYLMDHELKKAINMLEEGSYTYEKKHSVTLNKSLEVSKGQVPGKIMHNRPEILKYIKSESISSRFTVVIDKSGNSNTSYRNSDPVLLPVMPNPFTESAKIQFRLPEASKVTIRIISQSGVLMEIPFSGHYESGLHELDWTPFFSDKGFFIVQLITERVVSAQKAIRL